MNSRDDGSRIHTSTHYTSLPPSLPPLQGIIEFIPEFQALMHELNDLMAAGVANNEEVGQEGGRKGGG